MAATFLYPIPPTPVLMPVELCMHKSGVVSDILYMRKHTSHQHWPSVAPRATTGVAQKHEANVINFLPKTEQAMQTLVIHTSNVCINYRGQ